MIGYKLFRKRKDDTLGSLFINCTQKLYLNTWYSAENHPTKGYSVRPGWHICNEAKAPHLSMKNRFWYEVEFKDFYEFKRPVSQGGIWYIAKNIKTNN